MSAIAYPERYADQGHANFSTNEVGRDFLIGDLHGCFDELQELLQLVAFNCDTDRLFAVGDLIDRGSRSLDCLRLLKEPWFYSTLGNHEQMMMDTILYDERHDLWRHNGGHWYWLLNDDEKEELSLLIENHVSKLPVSATIQYPDVSVGLLHAEPPDDWVELETGEAEFALTVWGRYRVLEGNESLVEGIDMVFVGHTPRVKLSRLGNVYPIDTGAGYADGHLTMVMLPNTAPAPFFIQNLNRFVEKDAMSMSTHMHRTR